MLREENTAMPINVYSVCHIGLMSTGSEAGNELYLRDYTDEATW
jgi:hypothetical protein